MLPSGPGHHRATRMPETDPGKGGDVSDAVYAVTWVFILGSLGGVLVEAAWAALIEGRGLTSPRTGVLYLPFNPLYGLAAALGAVVLTPLAASPVAVFVLGAAVFTVVEYLASLVMEHVFGTVFWDYSNRPFNLHGRICLEFTGYWGVLSLALVYLVDPALGRVAELIPRPAGDLIALGVVIAMAIAGVVTMMGFTRLSSRLAGAGPRARDEWDRIADRFAPPDAMVAAFPQMNLSVLYRRLVHRGRMAGRRR